MTGKMLNLKLKYKGFVLDNARYLRDFKSKFFIGSDPALFWEILDDKFPKKHLLINKDGSSYTLNLLSNMQVSVFDNGNPLGMEELKKRGMVKGNKLTLSEKYEGKITFSKDWEIEYYFAKPFVHVPTAEEIAVVKQYAHYQELDPGEKITRNLLILLIIASFISSIFLENYLSKLKFASMENRIALIDRQRQQLAVAVQPNIVSQPAEEENAEEAVAEKHTATGKGDSQSNLKGAYARMFGDLDAKGVVPIDKNTIITETKTISITSGKGSGGAFGNGSGAGNGTKAADAFKVGSGGTGPVSLSGASGLKSLGDISGGNSLADVKGLNLKDVTGKIGGKLDNNVNVIKITSQNFEATQKRFAFAKRVVETKETLQTSGSNVAEGAPDDARIPIIVNSYKSRLVKIYENERFRSRIFGTVKFVIFINKDGSIADCSVEPTAGSEFTQDVLKKFQEQVMSWKISVSEPFRYDFSMTFTAN